MDFFLYVCMGVEFLLLFRTPAGGYIKLHMVDRKYLKACWYGLRQRRAFGILL